MAHLLTLRGRRALSPFRVDKLEAAFAAARPGHSLTGIAAAYWHFVELERELRRRAWRRSIDSLRTARMTREAGDRRRSSSSSATGHDLAVVVEGDRDRAQLRARRRAPHRAGRRLSDRTGAGALDARRPRGAPPAPARPDDRSGARFARSRIRPVRARRAEAADDDPAHGSGRAAIERANGELGLALAPDEIDYLEAISNARAAIRPTSSS